MKLLTINFDQTLEKLAPDTPSEIQNAPLNLLKSTLSLFSLSSSPILDIENFFIFEIYSALFIKIIPFNLGQV